MSALELFAVGAPYVALLILLAGISVRVLRWASSPVPFRIPTTCGQQRSLPWIRRARLDNPSSTPAVVGRLVLEALLFRSLFRNTRTDLREGGRLVESEDKALWLAALAFHWSLLVIAVRHLRFFVEPVPALAAWLERVDGVFEVGTPTLYLTDVAVVLALGYLAWRRVGPGRVRYISILDDYLAVFLVLAVAVSGIAMRYVVRVDTTAAKQFALGLARFTPVVPDGLGVAFFVHLGLVCALLAYFPVGKLVHMGGVFLSPTRNLANTSRAKRHVNPWDRPVPVHSYAEWEDEVRDELRIAGIPAEKD